MISFDITSEDDWDPNGATAAFVEFEQASKNNKKEMEAGGKQLITPYSFPVLERQKAIASCKVKEERDQLEHLQQYAKYVYELYSKCLLLHWDSFVLFVVLMIGYHLLSALDSEPKKWCFGHGGYLYARPSGQAALRSPNDYLTFAQACEPLPEEQRQLFLVAIFQSVLYLRRGPMTPGRDNDDDMVWKLHKSDGYFQ